jgi:uncharacterized protein
VYDVLSGLAEEGVKAVVFSGYGEPTLDPELGGYIEHVSRLGFRSATLFTNGYGLTPEKAAAWADAGLTGVLLSMHGLQDGHDRSVGRTGSFQEAVRALDIYVSCNVTVSVNTCITRYNLEEIPQLQRFLSSYPLLMHSIAFPEWSGNATAHQDELLTYQEINQWASLLLQNRNPFTRFDNIPLCVLGHRPSEQLRFEPSVLLAEKDQLSSDADDRVFPGACSDGGCRHRPICPGVERNYAQINGTEEVELFARRFASHGPRLRRAPRSQRRRRPGSHRSRRSTPVTCVIFKTTARCDAGCLYCAAYKESCEGELSISETRQTIFRLAEQAAREGKGKLSVIWHGGEPFLRGKDFYRSVWSIRERGGVDIEHMIQTNLLNLDEEWISLINEFDVPLSTSVDPFDDSLRVLRNGKPQYPRWLDRFLLFCEQGTKLGIVFTVARSHIGREEEIYSFFSNLQELTGSQQRSVGIRMNPIAPMGRARLDGKRTVPTVEEFGRFQLKMLELWLRDNRRVPIAPFSDLWRGSHYSCTFTSRCHRRFLGVGPSQTLSNCGRFLDCGLAFGTVDADIETRSDHELVQKLEAREPALRAGPCADCPYWNRCYGGCPVDAYTTYGDLNRETPFCSAYKSMFERIDQYGESHG